MRREPEMSLATARVESPAPQGRPQGGVFDVELSSRPQFVFDGATGRLQNLEAGETFVVRLDERPGRQSRAGALDHFVDRTLVVAPFRSVAPVLGRQLPLLVLGLFALLEATQLFARC